MSKTCCPDCSSTTSFSVEVKKSFELMWGDSFNEYMLGNAVDHSMPTFDDESEVTCGCGWTGKFGELKPATEKYRVVLILEVGDERINLKDWNWKEVLDLYAYESVSVDGVNKL